MRIILCVIILVLASSGSCFPACEEYPASSGYWYPGSYASQSLAASDVSDCVTAASAGGTIYLKAGSVDWSAGGISVTKALSVIGRTTGCPSACVDGTVIAAGTTQAFDISVDGARISGMTFTGTGHAWGVVQIYKYAAGNLKNVRIDHNKFIDLTSRAIAVGRFNALADSDILINAPNLIDNNRFESTEANFKAVQFYGGSGDNSVSSWLDTLILGGPNYIFFEDNIVDFKTWNDNQSTIDHDSGARTVIRYNTFAYGRLSYHGHEDTADPSGAPWRATHGFEIYSNTFTGDGWYRRIDIRGGTGVIYGNTFNGTIAGGTPIYYYYGRGDDATVCTDENACNGNNAVYDGNTVDMYGYPCYQQIGMTGSNGITPMPVYHWGNVWDEETSEANIASVMAFGDGCGIQHVAFGRDIILNGTTPKPGYTPYTYPHPLRLEGGDIPDPVQASTGMGMIPAKNGMQLGF